MRYNVCPKNTILDRVQLKCRILDSMHRKYSITDSLHPRCWFFLACTLPKILYSGAFLTHKSLWTYSDQNAAFGTHTHTKKIKSICLNNVIMSFVCTLFKILHFGITSSEIVHFWHTLSAMLAFGCTKVCQGNNE